MLRPASSGAAKKVPMQHLAAGKRSVSWFLPARSRRWRRCRLRPVAPRALTHVDGAAPICRQDYAYNAAFPEFRSRAEGCGKQVLELIQIFVNHVQQEGELGLPEVGDAGDPEVFQVCTRVFFLSGGAVGFYERSRPLLLISLNGTGLCCNLFGWRCHCQHSDRSVCRLRFYREAL